MADPHAINVADLIKDTCSQNTRTAYYKPQYKSRVAPSLKPTPSSQNLSYYTEGRKSARDYYDQSNFNLG